MTPRHRPTFALALATALVAPAPAVASAGAEEPVAERCHTWALSPEEAAGGAVSEVECYPLGEEPPAMRSADVALAYLYSGRNGDGTRLTVWDADCTGGTIVFGAGHPWDDIVSSTDLLACGTAKHWQHADNTGSNQTVSTSVLTNMTTTMDNQTSSIVYAP